jgi:hypothetical protein
VVETHTSDSNGNGITSELSGGQQRYDSVAIFREATAGNTRMIPWGG